MPFFSLSVALLLVLVFAPLLGWQFGQRRRKLLSASAGGKAPWRVEIRPIKAWTEVRGYYPEEQIQTTRLVEVRLICGKTNIAVASVDLTTATYENELHDGIAKAEERASFLNALTG